MSHKLQPTFSAGTISDEFAAAAGYDFYDKAIQESSNMLISAKGGIFNRPGTEYMGDAGDSAHPVILKRFKFSDDDQVVMEFGDDYINFWNSDGKLVYDADDYDDYDPGSVYHSFNVVKVGNYWKLNVWNYNAELIAYLTIIAPYGADTTGVTFELTYGAFGITNSGLDVTIQFDEDSDVTADNIQLYINALGTVSGVDFADFKVHGNSYYYAYTQLTRHSTKFSDAQALTTGTINSTSFVETTAQSIYTPGWAVYFHVDEAFSGGTSIHIDLQMDTVDAFSHPTVYGHCDFTTAQLVEGFTTHSSIALTTVSEKYLRLVYTITGTYSAGKMTAYLVHVPSDYDTENINQKIMVNSVGLEIIPINNTSQNTCPALYTFEEMTDGDPVRAIGEFYGFDAGLLKYMKTAQSADTVFIAGLGRPAELIRYPGNVWYLRYYPFKNGPFLLSNTDKDRTITSSETDIGNTSITGVSGSRYLETLFRIRHIMPAALASGSITGDDQQSTEIKCGGTWRFLTSGTWSAKINVEISFDSGSTWIIAKRITNNCDDTSKDTIDAANIISKISYMLARENGDPDPYNVNVYGTENEPCLVRVNCPSGDFTSGTCTYELTCDPYIHEGIVYIESAADDSENMIGLILKPLGSTEATDDWAECAWSDYLGWPDTVCFHQDRLWWGKDFTIYGSRLGSYWDFGRKISVLDDDGITLSLASKELNKIKNLVSLDDLLVLTSSSEWRVWGGDTGLTPTNYNLKEYGHSGSDYVTPEIIGNRAIFVQSEGVIIRDFGFSAESGIDGDDITFMASHLFEDVTIVDMEYQKNPYSVLWVVRSDGKMLTCAYHKQRNILAWTEHVTGYDSLTETWDEFESVCSYDVPKHNDLWFVVKRGSTRMIERITARDVSLTEARFSDCSKIVTSVSPTVTFTGLSHLNTKAVWVLADGYVIDDVTVTSNQIVINDAASKVVVGLPMNAYFTTLSLEGNLQDGTTLDRKKRIHSVMGMFKNTKGVQVGADDEHLEELTLTAYTGVGPVVVYTGKSQKIALDSQNDYTATILIKQPYPLPVHCIGLIPAFKIGAV